MGAEEEFIHVNQTAAALTFGRGNTIILTHFFDKIKIKMLPVYFIL